MAKTPKLKTQRRARVWGTKKSAASTTHTHDHIINHISGIPLRVVPCSRQANRGVGIESEELGLRGEIVDPIYRRVQCSGRNSLPVGRSDYQKKKTNQKRKLEKTS